VDLFQDDTVAYTCRENFSAFAFPAGAFYEIADFKIESAFESIFVGQIIHCIQFNLLDGVLKSLLVSCPRNKFK
jgi:hypothetical protein